jgi:hypothetical protein
LRSPADLNVPELSPFLAKATKLVFDIMHFARRIRWAGYIARTGEMRNAYSIVVGKLEGKAPVGRKRRRGVDNIKMDLRVIGWGIMECITLAQDREQ